MGIDANSSDIWQVAATIGNPTRAKMLTALANTQRLAATDLAAMAGVSASTASVHLAKLVRNRLVAVEPAGRLRFYRLAGPGVPEALEALSALSGDGDQSSPNALAGTDRQARMCYDHLAGRLGVQVTQALLRERFIRGEAWKRRPTVGSAYEITKNGVEFLRSFRISPPAVRARRRSYAHACLDRTERLPHIAGSLGAALAARLLDLRWIERAPGSRAVRVTSAGRRGLKATFGVEA